MNQRLAMVAALSLVLGGCGTGGWSLRVISEASSPRIVRAFDGETHVDRLVQGLGGAWIVVGSGPITGPVVIIDPVTCKELSRIASIPPHHAVGEINWDDTIDVIIEDPGSLAGVKPEPPDHTCPA